MLVNSIVIERGCVILVRESVGEKGRASLVFETMMAILKCKGRARRVHSVYVTERGSIA